MLDLKDYKITIGLEVHVALRTNSKLFSHSSSEYNATEFSFFDMGMPGMLPVLNKKPVEMALAFAYSVGSNVPIESYFERKHYFYADLPLGYQITQQHNPIMIGGTVPIMLDGVIKNVLIEHAHLECDAAKSIHDKYTDYTAIDLARCATPLLEIVSMPCMHSPIEARMYAEEVCSLVKFLDICDGKLEEGSFRVDASISLSETDVLGTRVEIKNISSFNFLETALNFEIERQLDLLLSGNDIVMETRLFDESTMGTKSMRKKETVNEYRYMTDPDITCLVIENDLIDLVRKEYSIDYFDIKKKFFDLVVEFNIDVDVPVLDKLLSKNMLLVVRGIINLSTEGKDDKEEMVKILKAAIFQLTDIYDKIRSQKILTFSDFKIVMDKKLPVKEMKDTFIKFLSMEIVDIESCIPILMDESLLENEVKEVLISYPEEIEKYKQGQHKILQFLIGKVMFKLKGKATAQAVKEMVESYLLKN